MDTDAISGPIRGWAWDRVPRISFRNGCDYSPNIPPSINPAYDADKHKMLCRRAP